MRHFRYILVRFLDECHARRIIDIRNQMLGLLAGRSYRNSIYHNLENYL